MPDANSNIDHLITDLAELVQESRWADFYAAFRAHIAPLQDQRNKLHQEVVATIRRIEVNLEKVMQGQPIKGSYNIFTSTMPLNAWNVRRQNKSDQLRLPRHDEHEPQALILVPEGAFAIAKVEAVRRVRRGYEEQSFQWRLYDPLDEDFRVDDLRHCLETVLHACHRHLLKSSGSDVVAQKLRRLNDAMTDTLMRFTE